MELTLEHIEKFIGKKFADEWHAALSKFLPQYEINTLNRTACFLGQCYHESGGFKFLKENLNYTAERMIVIWPKHFPTMAIAKKYAGKPESIANRAYANRMGNGPEETGDGWKYIGRGIIQLTGKTNYQTFANSIKKPLAEIPDYLGTIEGAVHSAAWFWNSRKINPDADKLDIKAVTLKINGGLIGLSSRAESTDKAIKILTEKNNGTEET